MRPTTLLLTTLLALACANQPDHEMLEEPDDSSSTAAPEPDRDACAAPDIAPCLEGDDLAACTGTAIKYEYEMLEARHEGERPAFECHRDTLATVLDHACDLGDDDACTRAPSIRKAAPPA